MASFTFALASGGLAARLAWSTPWTWDAQQLGAVGAWLVFGALAPAWALGVRGARQAVLSVGGTALVLALLVGGPRAPRTAPGGQERPERARGERVRVLHGPRRPR